MVITAYCKNEWTEKCHTKILVTKKPTVITEIVSTFRPHKRKNILEDEIVALDVPRFGAIIGWKMTTKDIYILIPGTCECYLIWQKRKKKRLQCN